MKVFSLTISILCLSAAGAAGQVPLTGSFTAQATCSAPPSIREGAANPGNVTVRSGQVYELLGRNSVPGSHYLIRIPGAEPDRRWVAYGCGAVGEGPAGRDAAQADPADAPSSFVLAASWPSAFCETVPHARECAAGPSAERFVLHGLWPQTEGRDSHCGVAASVRQRDDAGRWRSLPELAIDHPTSATLARVMPGVQSGLDKHQWFKHGTCSGMEPNTYFNRAAGLIDALNASPVRDLFVGSIGRTLSADDIRRAFDKAFGRGAGQRVLVDCVSAGERRLVRELRIAVAGPIDGALAESIAAAPTQPRGCRTGEIDAPG